MAEYFIEQPKYTNAQRVTSFVLRIIFPLLLVWDSLQLIANQLMGAWFANQLWKSKPSSSHSSININGLNLTSNKIISHDNASLDTVEIRHFSQNSLTDEYRAFIVYFPDLDESYEDMLSEMSRDAQALERNAIGFNYRGIGKSQGRITCAHDLFIDGLAQVQYLLNLGVKPHNITLKGKGLGGAIATLVAHHLAQHNQLLYLFNDRSFSSLSNLLTNRVYPIQSSSGLPEHLQDKIISAVILGVVKVFLSLIKWDINVGPAFRALPENYKEYTVIRPRHPRMPTNIEDQTIPYPASLHMAFKGERREHKKSNTLMKKFFSGESREEQEAFNFTLKSYKDARNQRKIERLSDNKCNLAHSNAHQQPLHALNNRYGKNAATFFYDFVNHTTEAEIPHEATQAPYLLS